jgi:hypothetical protein
MSDQPERKKKIDEVLEELDEEETKQQKLSGGKKAHYKGFKKGFERKFTKWKKKE